MKEAILCSYFRGQVTRRQKKAGGMAAVGLGRDSIQPYLVDGVVIARENSPESVTLSGDEDKLDLVIQCIKRNGEEVFARRLHVDMAYHSRKSFYQSSSQKQTIILT